MAVFLWTGALVLLLVLGAWLKLAPSATERRQARARMAAVGLGLQVKRLSALEQQALGDTAPILWYCLPVASLDAERSLAVCGDSGWRWEQGEPRPLPGIPLPGGVRALLRDQNGLRVGWDEGQPDSVPAIQAWLKAWMALETTP